MEDERERERYKERILWICDALLSSYKIIEPERKWKCRALRFALAKWYTLINDSSDDNKNNNQNSYIHISYHFSFISFEFGPVFAPSEHFNAVRVSLYVCVYVLHIHPLPFRCATEIHPKYTNESDESSVLWKCYKIYGPFHFLISIFYSFLFKIEHIILCMEQYLYQIQGFGARYDFDHRFSIVSNKISVYSMDLLNWFV